MVETWKPIPGYEGLYEASDFGRVRNVERLDSRNHPIKSRVMVTSRDKYEKVNLRKGGAMRRFRVHRLIAITFLGPEQDGKNEVNHKDGDKLNNNVSNLEWVSRSTNVAHGFRVLGVLHPKSKRRAKTFGMAVTS